GRLPHAAPGVGCLPTSPGLLPGSGRPPFPPLLPLAESATAAPRPGGGAPPGGDVAHAAGGLPPCRPHRGLPKRSRRPFRHSLPDPNRPAEVPAREERNGDSARLGELPLGRPRPTLRHSLPPTGTGRGTRKMNLLGDLKSPALMYLKAILFLLAGTLAAVGI